MSSLIPNVDAGPAIINLPYFVLVFISGTYFPISGGLATVSKYLPLRPMILSMYKVFDPTNTRQPLGAAPAAHPGHGVGSAGSTVFAVRHFRWVPRRG